MVPTALPSGFVAVHGPKAWLRVLATASLMDLHRCWGYDLLSIPSLELASSFSGGVVGLSPWPDWNPKNCFTISVSDYDDDYQETGCRQMVLIPEGTVPV